VSRLADVAAERIWGLAIPEFPRALAWLGARRRSIAMLSSEGTLAGVDAVAGDGLWRIEAHAGAASLAVSPDGSVIATGGEDGHLRLWSADDGAARAETKMSGWVERIAWTPDGTRLACSAGRRVWLVAADGRIERVLEGHPSTVSGLAWRADGVQLAVSHYSGVTLWEPALPEPRRTLERKGSILDVAWHPKGRWLAAGCQDQAVQVWSLRNAGDLYMSGYMTKLSYVGWDAEGRYLATAGGPGGTVWDFAGSGPQGSKPLSLHGHENLVTALAWRPTGTAIAVGDADGRVQLWRINGKAAERRARLECGGGIAAFAWSSDGEMLVAATEDGNIDGFTVRL
jgi:WD40 repeat protein